MVVQFSKYLENFNEKPNIKESILLMDETATSRKGFENVQPKTDYF